MSALEQTELLTPNTLDEALRFLADENTRGTLLCGGTDLMVQWEAGVRPAPARVINIKGLTELSEIKMENGALVIGAGVTHAALRHSSLVIQCAPSLAEAAATVGGAQIQALGTIGGSIGNASPASDMAPSLLVADAIAELASVRGIRKVPLPKFILGYRKLDLAPDELIVRFHLAPMPVGAKENWHKLGPRAAQAISKVMGSYRGKVESGRISLFAVALGSVAPTAVRLPEIEQWLIGRAIDAETLKGAEKRTSDIVKPIADIRSTAEYRRWVSGRLVRGFLEHLASPS
ncbi:MAG: FAD binding domain-containing protein [Kiritimatiellae bacterium]|nr:FAD binding domain-containing protein [Kiritimatiellia bacterium]